MQVRNGWFWQELNLHYQPQCNTGSRPWSRGSGKSSQQHRAWQGVRESLYLQQEAAPLLAHTSSNAPLSSQSPNAPPHPSSKHTTYKTRGPSLASTPSSSHTPASGYGGARTAKSATHSRGPAHVSDLPATEHVTNAAITRAADLTHQQAKSRIEKDGGGTSTSQSRQHARRQSHTVHAHPSPRLITAQLSRASSLQQLRDCVVVHLDSLNAIHASAVLVQAVRLCGGGGGGVSGASHHRPEAAGDERAGHFAWSAEGAAEALARQQLQQQKQVQLRGQEGNKMRRSLQQSERAALAELLDLVLQLLFQGRATHKTIPVQPPPLQHRASTLHAAAEATATAPTPPYPNPVHSHPSSPVPSAAASASAAHSFGAAHSFKAPHNEAGSHGSMGGAGMPLQSTPYIEAGSHGSMEGTGMPLQSTSLINAGQHGSMGGADVLLQSPSSERGKQAGASRHRPSHSVSSAAQPLIQESSPRELANAAWALVKLAPMFGDSSSFNSSSSSSSSSKSSATSLEGLDEVLASGSRKGSNGTSSLLQNAAPSSASSRHAGEEGGSSPLMSSHTTGSDAISVPHPMLSVETLAHHFSRAILRAAASPCAQPAGLDPDRSSSSVGAGSGRSSVGRGSTTSRPELMYTTSGREAGGDQPGGSSSRSRSSSGGGSFLGGASFVSGHESKTWDGSSSSKSISSSGFMVPRARGLSMLNCASSQALANLLWALASWGLPHASENPPQQAEHYHSLGTNPSSQHARSHLYESTLRAFEALSAAFLRQLPSASPQEVAMVCWALGKLQRTPHSCALLPALIEACPATITHQTPLGLANTLWGLSKVVWTAGGRSSMKDRDVGRQGQQKLSSSKEVSSSRSSGISISSSSSSSSSDGGAGRLCLGDKGTLKGTSLLSFSAMGDEASSSEEKGEWGVWSGPGTSRQGPDEVGSREGLQAKGFSSESRKDAMLAEGDAGEGGARSMHERGSEAEGGTQPVQSGGRVWLEDGEGNGVGDHHWMQLFDWEDVEGEGEEGWQPQEQQQQQQQRPLGWYCLGSDGQAEEVDLQPLLNAAEARALELVPELARAPQEAANLMAAMLKLGGAKGPKLWRAMQFEVAQCQPSRWSPQALSALLGAFASARRPCHALLASLACELSSSSVQEEPSSNTSGTSSASDSANAHAGSTRSRADTPSSTRSDVVGSSKYADGSLLTPALPPSQPPTLPLPPSSFHTPSGVQQQLHDTAVHATVAEGQQHATELPPLLAACSDRDLSVFLWAFGKLGSMPAGVGPQNPRAVGKMQQEQQQQPEKQQRQQLQHQQQYSQGDPGSSPAALDTVLLAFLQPVLARQAHRCLPLPMACVALWAATQVCQQHALRDSSRSSSNKRTTSVQSPTYPLLKTALELAEMCCTKLAAAQTSQYGPPYLVAMVLWCCGQLGYKHKGLWARVAGGARTHTLRGMSKSHIASVCASAARLRVRNPRLFGAAADALLEGWVCRVSSTADEISKGGWPQEPAASTGQVAELLGGRARSSSSSSSSSSSRSRGSRVSCKPSRPPSIPSPHPPPALLLTSLMASFCALRLPLPRPLLHAMRAALASSTTIARLPPRSLHTLLCTYACAAAQPKRPPRTRLVAASANIGRGLRSVRTRSQASPSATAIAAANDEGGRAHDKGARAALGEGLCAPGTRTHALSDMRTQRRGSAPAASVAQARASRGKKGTDNRRTWLPVAYLISPRTFARLASHARNHVHSYSPEQLVQLLVACARVRHYDEGLMEEVTSALHAQQYQSSFLNALDLEAEDRPPARSSYVGGKLALSSRDGSIVSNSASTHCTSGAVRNRIDVSSKDGRGSSLHATAKGGGDLTPTQLAQLMWAVGYLGAGVLMQWRPPVHALLRRFSLPSPPTRIHQRQQQEQQQQQQQQGNSHPSPFLQRLRGEAVLVLWGLAVQQHIMLPNSSQPASLDEPLHAAQPPSPSQSGPAREQRQHIHRDQQHTMATAQPASLDEPQCAAQPPSPSQRVPTKTQKLAQRQQQVLPTTTLLLTPSRSSNISSNASVTTTTTTTTTTASSEGTPHGSDSAMLLRVLLDHVANLTESQLSSDSALCITLAQALRLLLHSPRQDVRSYTAQCVLGSKDLGAVMSSTSSSNCSSKSADNDNSSSSSGGRGSTSGCTEFKRGGDGSEELDHPAALGCSSEPSLSPTLPAAAASPLCMSRSNGSPESSPGTAPTFKTPSQAAAASPPAAAKQATLRKKGNGLGMASVRAELCLVLRQLQYQPLGLQATQGAMMHTGLEDTDDDEQQEVLQARQLLPFPCQGLVLLPQATLGGGQQHDGAGQQHQHHQERLAGVEPSAHASPHPPSRPLLGEAPHMSNPSPHAPKGAALIIAPPSAFAAPQSVGKVGVLGVGAKAPAATRSRLNNSSSSVDSRQDSRTGSSYDHSSGSSQGSGFQGRGESSKGVHEMGLFAGVIEDTAEGGGAGAPPAAGTGAFEPLGPLFTTCALLGESGWAPVVLIPAVTWTSVRGGRQEKQRFLRQLLLRWGVPGPSNQ